MVSLLPEDAQEATSNHTFSYLGSAHRMPLALIKWLDRSRFLGLLLLVILNAFFSPAYHYVCDDCVNVYDFAARYVFMLDGRPASYQTVHHHGKAVLLWHIPVCLPS